MKTPSTAFDTAFKQKIMPPVEMRITHKQIDEEIVNQTTASLSNTESISIAEELFSVESTDFIQYSTCEPDRHIMNGKYKLVDEENTNTGIGLLGSELNSEGAFTNYPNITYELTEQVSTPFYIVFDTLNNEYATEFDIVGYQSETVISTLSYTDNTETELVTDSGIQNYDKVELVIKKWSVPDRRARVSRFQLGVIKVFKNDLLGDVRIFEQYSPTSLTVSTNTILFNFSDTETQFNPLTPNGWATYLQQNQTIIAEIGINGEYVLVGTYLLSDWSIGENIVTLEGSCAVSLADADITYSGGSETLYQHAVNIFALLGIEDYVLDDSLKDITAELEETEMNGREMLRALAIAGMCAYYADRDNISRIEPPKTAQYDYVLDFDIAAKPDTELQDIIKEIKFGDYTYYMNDTGTSLDVDATFIADDTHAEEVAVWLEAYLNKRIAFTYDARPNPKVEGGDIFEAQTHFSDTNSNVQLLNNTMNFSKGGLLSVQKVKVA